MLILEQSNTATLLCPVLYERHPLHSFFRAPCPFTPTRISFISPRSSSVLSVIFLFIAIWLLLCPLLYPCSQLSLVSNTLFFIPRSCTSPVVSLVLPSTLLKLFAPILCFSSILVIFSYSQLTTHLFVTLYHSVVCYIFWPRCICIFWLLIIDGLIE
jgi:hypothetical protein